MIYGNKFLIESSNNIYFYEKIDNISNKYCNKICDSLSKEEKEEFGIGDEKYIEKSRYKDIKNKLLKRIVLLYNNKPTCFIDVYKENRLGKYYGEIAIITHSNFRHKGYASILMEKIVNWYNQFDIDIESLTYPVDKNNTSSINLAKKFKFKKMNKSSYYFSEEYYNDFPVYEYKK